METLVLSNRFILWKCMEFDGSGDYFSGTYNADFNFGTGDFTIEMCSTQNSK